MFTLPDGSPSIYSPKATTLRQEIRAVCENQLISSRRFAEHLKQCYTESSERLLWTPADEKRWAEKARKQ